MITQIAIRRAAAPLHPVYGHQFCVALMSLNAITNSAAREPKPRGDLGPVTDGGESRFRSDCRAQMDPVLGG